jgi:hypothetical protein
VRARKLASLAAAPEAPFGRLTRLVYTAQSARFDRLRQFWPQDDVDDADYRLVHGPIGENSTASSSATSGCPNHLVSAPAWLPASRYGPKTTLMTPVTDLSLSTHVATFAD